MKRIVAKVGSYTKDNEEKNEWVKLGVILSNENGEYVILDPTINMAGIAYKQRVNGIAKQGSDSVIASIFTDEPKSAPQQAAEMSQRNSGDFDDDIPFMSYEFKSIV